MSAYFSGTAYLKNLIPLDDTYNFPETNVVTFAPNSRSGWHVHGGSLAGDFAHIARIMEQSLPPPLAPYLKD